MVKIDAEFLVFSLKDETLMAIRICQSLRLNFSESSSISIPLSLSYVSLLLHSQVNEGSFTHCVLFYHILSLNKSGSHLSCQLVLRFISFILSSLSSFNYHRQNNSQPSSTSIQPTTANHAILRKPPRERNPLQFTLPGSLPARWTSHSSQSLTQSSRGCTESQRSSRSHHRTETLTQIAEARAAALEANCKIIWGANYKYETKQTLFESCGYYQIVVWKNYGNG
jgi:hypothetical protein